MTMNDIVTATRAIAAVDELIVSKRSSMARRAYNW